MLILNAKVERNKTQNKLNIAKSWKIYQKVMLRNAKIKEISNFGPRKITETILCSQKPLMLLMKWTDIGKIAFSKLFVLDYGSLAWIQSNLSVLLRSFAQAKFATFFTNKSFVTFNYFQSSS